MSSTYVFKKMTSYMLIGAVLTLCLAPYALGTGLPEDGSGDGGAAYEPPVVEFFEGRVGPGDIEARAAVLYEANSGLLLYSLNPDMPTAQASTTKIMTALLCLENADLDDAFTTTQTALEGLDPRGSSVNLKVGEEMSVEDLLYCLMVASGNDAANVIAEGVAGSVSAFINMMNRRAAELGCRNTVFRNAHGLDEEGHHTTANDLYLITREALKHPDFMRICNTAAKKIAPTNMTGQRSFSNTNYLISSAVTNKYLYYPAKGIKTGHTGDAGNCLVSSAEKDGLYYISVVLGCERDAAADTVKSFTETVKLLDWGQGGFKRATLVNASGAGPRAEVAVTLAQNSDYVTLIPANSLEAIVPSYYDAEDLDISVIAEQSVEAPVEKGQVLGYMTVSFEGKEYGRIDLIAQNGVEQSSILYYLQQVQIFIAQREFRIGVIVAAGVILLYILIMLIVNNTGSRKRKKYLKKAGFLTGRKYRE